MTIALHPGTVAKLETLTRGMADRNPPLAFAGRLDELDLLRDSVCAVAKGGVGGTVLIQGVPGSGKTALLNHFASIFADDSDDVGAVIAVPVDPRTLDQSPAEFVASVDKLVRNSESFSTWQAKINSMVDIASVFKDMAVSAITKRSSNEFKPFMNEPATLAEAFTGYGSFRFGRSASTIMLLIDEAQELADTQNVRDNIRELHTASLGETNLVAAFFGLTGTELRLQQLGLSRMASGHVVTLGTLSELESEQVVHGTLDAVFSPQTFADGPMDDVARNRWISSTAEIILIKGGGFPHHLNVGCAALAKIVLDDGIDPDGPPLANLALGCDALKREYYESRLKPWRSHSMALSCVFSEDGAATYAGLKAVMMVSDDNGMPVPDATAAAVIDALIETGYISSEYGKLTLTLPSLGSYFAVISDESKRISPDTHGALMDEKEKHRKGLSR